MFQKTFTPEERLRVWRSVRKTQYDSVESMLAEFKGIKLEQRYLDYYTPASWPSPFEIVQDGLFCQTGITLVLAATLLNKGFITTEVLEFPVISNNITGIDGTVLLHENQVYNFISGQVVSKEYALANSVVYDIHTLKVKDFFH